MLGELQGITCMAAALYISPSKGVACINGEGNLARAQQRMLVSIKIAKQTHDQYQFILLN